MLQAILSNLVDLRGAYSPPHPSVRPLLSFARAQN